MSLLLAAIMESFYSKGRTSLFSSLQKPLLQVSYGSCSSLPARWASDTNTTLTASRHIFIRGFPHKHIQWYHSLLHSVLKLSHKVRETPLHTTSHHRKRSTQSDTALLPSDVYFQRTPSPAAVSSKTISKTGRRRGSKVRHPTSTHAWLLTILSHILSVYRNICCVPWQKKQTICHCCEF